MKLVPTTYNPDLKVGDLLVYREELAHSILRAINRFKGLTGIPQVEVSVSCNLVLDSTNRKVKESIHTVDVTTHL